MMWNFEIPFYGHLTHVQHCVWLTLVLIIALTHPGSDAERYHPCVKWLLYWSSSLAVQRSDIAGL